MGQLIDARTAAARLGVDVRTLYAYVSRGALRRVPGPDGRSSRYDADELGLLARRSRPRTLPRPAASIDLVIATQVSTVTDGLVRYRGTDVLDLVAAGESFEAVASRLWSPRDTTSSTDGLAWADGLAQPDGRASADDRAPSPHGRVSPDGRAPADGRASGDGRAVAPAGDTGRPWASATGSSAAIALAGLPVVQRFAAVVASMAGAGDGPAVPGDAVTALGPLASDLSQNFDSPHSPHPSHPSGPSLPPGLAQPAWDWPAWGRALIDVQVEASGPPPRTARPDRHAEESALDPAEPTARRLWRCWSPLHPTRPRTQALNTALVLLAEHELALSTLAVRVAASARAAPAGCLLAGLGVLSGALHGDAGRLVQERLAGRGPAAGPELGIGFGHSVHRHGDPRAAPLLEAVRAIATPADRDLVERAARDAPAPPNIDFALGALCHVARMPPGAATGIFAVARTAGWIAHAAEEYTEPPLRFRGQAVVPAR